MFVNTVQLVFQTYLSAVKQVKNPPIKKKVAIAILP
jgi:hypothetical protein